MKCLYVRTYVFVCVQNAIAQTSLIKEMHLQRSDNNFQFCTPILCECNLYTYWVLYTYAEAELWKMKICLIYI